MEVDFMNGLKLIRTKCNYSQAALAEKLGVSRQAINMWENAKKAIPDKRKEELCEFFGIENADWLDEIDDETVDEICDTPMYKGLDEVSEHFHFSPTTTYKYGDNALLFDTNSAEFLSLDERCSLKRLELKAMLNEIQEYVEEAGLKNSYERMCRTNITMQAVGGVLDALKTCMTQSIHEKMPYVYTVLGVVDALNIAFGNVTKEDVINSVVHEKRDPDLYDYSYWAADLSDDISKRISTFKKKIEQYEKS
jgi:transcriptional regulator with XRE-family HTH domain